jgi:hydrogenase maturation protease
LNILVIGIGNPSRGDDALGPLLVESIESLGLPGVETLCDFQMQVEYVLDLHGHDLVIFVDASLNALAPFEYYPTHARSMPDYTSHALAPEALLAIYEAHYGEAHPPAYVLAIRGTRFELGDPLSLEARAHLDVARVFLVEALKAASNGESNPSGQIAACNRGCRGQ